MSESTPVEVPTPLLQAIGFGQGDGSDRPDTEVLITELLQLEKQKPTAGATYRDLVGDWRLTFFTGTQKAQKQAGQVLKAGQFVPKWINVQIAYRSDVDTYLPTLDQPLEDSEEALSGTIENSVKLGALELKLTGPAQFYGDRQILAFDFTRLSLKILGQSLCQGYIRGGKTREVNFGQQALKQQAFFKYFWIHPNSIAARGREGGLALWIRA